MNIQYLVDQEGKTQGVLMSLDEFEQILDLLEETQDIKDYRAAKEEAGEWVSLDEVKKQLGL